MKIKPCPFCGNTHLHTIRDNNSRGDEFFAVECDHCNFSGPEVVDDRYDDDNDDGLEKAVELWNKRYSCSSEIKDINDFSNMQSKGFIIGNIVKILIDSGINQEKSIILANSTFNKAKNEI